ncbi:dihydrofolate reductase family protein [Chryseolinea sp. H1M3-3]|uniref:dihydrofolate reductase family protein n=1 Tax=Chryseolinea sp. H1M3-3 TaxID=3034144 RepID=UPI0023EC0D69|nr:dihydrofolate reductase family protein [Chryseolinea sp. H1M3-3]
MRKLVLEVQISIDGYIAETDGKTDWMIWNWGPEWKWDQALRTYHTDLTKSADCFLISRQMAEEGFIAHWAHVSQNPDDPRYSFAKHISDTPRVVFSKTLKKSKPIPGGWQNTDLASGDVVEEVLKLKGQKGKNMLVYGGATLVSSLINAQLVDELHLIINPVALGKGLPIFNDRQHMNLVTAKSFDSGIVVLHYERKPN